MAELHENFIREEDTPPGSDRALGLVLGGALGLIGLLPLLRGHGARWWALGLAGAFFLASATRPVILGPLNRLWHRLGLLLHSVVSPVVLGLLFFTTVTPIGLLMRGLGRDLLRLRFEPDAPTYWIERRPPGPAPDSMPR
ncbi:MAG TPA: SxtJ family membrane protein, partial [Gemmatimonadales bacterium]|nr:SxtJ family membrane protein [Gemmatimonadales bacterium]